MYQIKKASELIKKSNRTVLLTGAGISTESGIPDFRTPGKGLWEKVDPMEVLSKNTLYNNPEKFYKEGFKILMGIIEAEPNKGHLAIAEMEKLGFLDCIITQNIDNLHQKAGSKNLLEVHGHIRTGSCIECGEKVSFNIIKNKINKNQIPPKCNKCNGNIRPDVVLFGDGLPEDFNTAWDKVRESDLLVVVGSSLTVAPVSYLPGLASRLIIINLGDTPYDDMADVVIREKTGIVLPKILKYLKSGG
ncbi:NAD-dependent deacetylase [Thermohalobacter berrensis]|uniref:protein acetyllysine N-acetyltransferase n=1 Tax=Thermohalobacter berrensis TaxID=99594 RepID=A0A419T4T0_9FIRM|nr:NAD-dependent deacylase [Thermohalobacter berrensis]RKD32491.1 NAD-dependent deacetylase [Thermohalobacter berrensis]